MNRCLFIVLLIVSVQALSLRTNLRTADDVSNRQPPFDKFDTDNSGTLDFSETKAAVYSMGERPTDSQLHGNIWVVDKNNDDLLNRREYHDLISRYR